MDECKLLAKFTHCPKCGGEFRDNNIKSKQCAECGFIYYFNPSAAVAAIIRVDNKILVSTRAFEPSKGAFDLPGGFVDSFESGEEAIRREVMEECNLNITSTKYLYSIPNSNYSYSDFNIHTLDLFFECEVESLERLKAADDVAKLHLINIKDIDLSKFGFTSVREGVKRYAEMFMAQ